MNKKEFIEKIKNLPFSYIWGEPYLNKEVVFGLVKQLDEPEKVTIPQFVADWIEECKNDDFHLFGAMEAISLNQKKLDYWFREDDNMELFARAWLDGYEVEKENRYIVKFKNIQKGTEYLKYDRVIGKWYFGLEEYSIERSIYHTHKQLEEVGLDGYLIAKVLS